MTERATSLLCHKLQCNCYSLTQLPDLLTQATNLRNCFHFSVRDQDTLTGSMTCVFALQYSSKMLKHLCVVISSSRLPDLGITVFSGPVQTLNFSCAKPNPFILST